MECGSQFSVALTKSGAVYTWYVHFRQEELSVCIITMFSQFSMCPVICRGKGDYHRLGHGSDDHVRRPRQVQGLQGKKVIAIATGSLHCVCCTEDGMIDHFSMILPLVPFPCRCQYILVQFSLSSYHLVGFTSLQLG